MNRKRDLYKILEAYEDSKEQWIVFFVYDFSSPHKWGPARVRYKLAKLKDLDKKWKTILADMNEDNFHHTLGNIKDKEIRSFNQPVTDDDIFKTQNITAYISSKERLLEIIKDAGDESWTEIVDLKPETEKHFGDIVGTI